MLLKRLFFRVPWPCPAMSHVFITGRLLDMDELAAREALEDHRREGDRDGLVLTFRRGVLQAQGPRERE